MRFSEVAPWVQLLVSVAIWSVGGGAPSAKPWLIRDSQLEQEGNMVFLKLERKDTALGRLITGHSRSLVLSVVSLTVRAISALQFYIQLTS